MFRLPGSISKKSRNMMKIPKIEEIENEEMEEISTAEENDILDIETQMLVSRNLEVKLEILQCEICDKYFQTKVDMVYHMKIHHSNEKVYNCAHCDRKFLHKGTLRRHLFTHDLFEKKFSCSHCGECFYFQSALNYHVAKRHTDQYLATERYECFLCGMIFTLKWKFRQHYENHKAPEGENTHFCPICQRPHFSFSDMKTHLLSHSYRQGYKCRIPGCGIWIQHMKNYLLHVKAHGPGQYLCHICGKRFSWPSRLKEHVHIHSIEKAYKCETCGKSFSQNNGLAAHRTLHTNERPHKCSFCGNTFRLRAHLLRHEMIHNPDKSFECMVCGKKFLQERYLKQHSVVHSSRVPFWCANCDKSFHFKCSFKQHLTTCGSKKDSLFCTVCNHYYVDLNLYVEHMCTHKKGWNCLKCNKPFEDFSLLSQHVMACDAQKDVQVEIENETQPEYKKDASIDFLEELIAPHKVSKAKSPKANIARREIIKKPMMKKEKIVLEEEDREFEEQEESAEEPENASATEIKNELKQEMSKCLECEKCFKNEDDLVEHILVHAAQDGQFYCKTCDQKFRRKLSFINHWNRNHSKTLENDKLAEVYRKVNKTN